MDNFGVGKEKKAESLGEVAAKGSLAVETSLKNTLANL